MPLESVAVYLIEVKPNGIVTGIDGVFATVGVPHASLTIGVPIDKLDDNVAAHVLRISIFEGQVIVGNVVSPAV